jgi:hypothetical protein
MKINFLDCYIHCKMLTDLLSDFLFGLHRSLSHQGSTEIRDISPGMPGGEPDAFSLPFLRILMHQDLITSLGKKSLN